MPVALAGAIALALVSPPSSSVVVGAGPAGLATAIVLAKRGWPDVKVLDRLPPPPALDDDTAWSDTARFYLIGIGGRGQRALRSIGAWDALEPHTAVVRGRKDWAPGAGVDGGIETIRADRPPSNIIQRDRLVASLLDQARGLGVTVQHEVDVSGISWDGDEAILQCSPCGEECATDEAGGVEYDGSFELRTPFVVASDGVRRTVANALEAEAKLERRWALPGRRFRVTRFEDTSVRVYKTVPFSPPPEWRRDINYSARTSKFNFDALPAPTGRAPSDDPSAGAPVGEYCGVLLIKPDDEATQGLRDVPGARAYFDELLPQFSPYISDEALQAVLDKPPSRLPVFRFAGPTLHLGGSTVLIGDVIHSVKLAHHLPAPDAPPAHIRRTRLSIRVTLGLAHARLAYAAATGARAQPYFGLGVNSAFEDIAALAKELDDQPTLPGALAAYSRRRAPEARVLVEISRSFDRGGLRGFASFIGPIILDGIFGGLPLVGKAFAPNTLAMLQNPDVSYVGIRWRKRIDRAVQLAIVALAANTAARATAHLARCAFGAVARLAVSAGLSSALPAAVARPRFLVLPGLALALAAARLLRRPSAEPLPSTDGADVRGGPLRSGDVADVLASQTAVGASSEGPGGTRPGY